MKNADAVRTRLLFVSLAIAGAVTVASCAGVQPWERDLMAKRSMALDTHPEISAAEDHIYFSKEASMGGRNASGGGCGCN